MSQLESLLRRAGRLDDEQLQSARSGVERDGLGWVDSLIEHTDLDEQDLVAFLQSKLLIPRVEQEILDTVDDKLATLIASDLAHRHELLPVQRDDLGNLTIAMLDPTDERGVTEVANATGGYVIRAAAPRSALRRAITRLYGQSSDRPRVETPSRLMVDETESDLGPAPQSFSPLISAQERQRIESATDQESLTESIFDALESRVSRLMLFVHSRDELRGQHARGKDLLIEEIRKIRIPTRIPSRFAGVIAQRRPFFGKMGRATEVDRQLDHAMRSLDGKVLIFPVVLGEKVPLLIFGHRLDGDVDSRALTDFSTVVSRGLQHVISSARQSGTEVSA